VPRLVAADRRVPVRLAFAGGEGVGCTGARSLVGAMVAALPRPRAVIVGEPPMMDIVNGHKGSFSFFTEVTGHAVHSSRIDLGVSAVMIGARLATWFIDTMAENKARARADCPFLPPYTSLHCGMIQGGVAANIVAEACSFVTDIRYLPDEDPQGYMDRYRAFIRTRIEPEMKAIAPATGVEIVPRSHVPGLAPEPEGGAESMVRALLPTATSGVVSYATEAGIFQRAGWSTVVVGPGDIAQAHQANEYIELSQFAAGEAFLHRLVDSLAR